MALGTGAITLEEIRNEIGLGSTATLDDCFNAAIGTFDPTYSKGGSVEWMSEFRGYSHVCVGSLTSFLVWPTHTTSGSACSPVGGSATYYHNGGSNPAANGDTVYTDAGGCTLMPDSGSNWVSFLTGVSTPRYRCQINSSGVITGRTAC